MTPEALARLHAASFDHERPWSAREFRGLLAGPEAILLGDEEAILLGRVVADEAEVMTLATHPSARRQGHARALLDAFHAEAGRRGAARTFLEVAEDNAAARALYEGEGYRVVGRRPRYYARSGGGSAAALVLTRGLP